MAAEYGLYLSSLPGGQIKRDLAGPTGKVSLENTTIQDELILFSELSFSPYAKVVDMIRTSAAYLCVDDNGGEGEVNPSVYKFILGTVTDLANTLMEENSIHGLLLWTAMEDLLPMDDPIQACQDLLATLAEAMQFQFVVNEVLHDLGNNAPLDPEKYDGLWELSVTEILALGDGLSSRYHFRSAVDYYHFLLLSFIAEKSNVALCQCCGRYFVPKTRKKMLYCDRILKDEKTCKEWGPVLKHKLAVQRNEVIKTFDKAKRKMYKRYERAESGINQKPSEKDLSYAEYYEWLDQATKARDDYLAGRIGLEEALKIVNSH